MSDVLIASIIIAAAIVYAARQTSKVRQPGETRVSLKEGFLYGDQGVVAERVAIAIMSAELVAQHMTDPQYHEAITHYETAALHHQTRDKAEALLRDTNVFAAPAQDKFVRLAWDLYDHIAYLQGERLKGWYSRSVDVDDLTRRASAVSA